VDAGGRVKTNLGQEAPIMPGVFKRQWTLADGMASEARSDAFTFSCPAVKSSPDMLVFWLRASQIFRYSNANIASKGTLANL
jgi:hypothetical protein